MKIEAALGFCQRAGKLVSGDFAVTKAVKSGMAFVVIADRNISDQTRKKWQDSCSYHDVPYYEADNPASMCGRDGKMIFAATDRNFADMIIKALTQCMSKEGTQITGGNN